MTLLLVHRQLPACNLKGPCSNNTAKPSICSALTNKATVLPVGHCTSDITSKKKKKNTMEMLECPLCLCLMCEPVTVSCGHTFCRRCVGGYLPSKCPLCKERLKQKEVKNTRNNVLLIGVVEKCWPEEKGMKCQIQEKLKATEFAEALRLANEGLNLGK